MTDCCTLNAPHLCVEAIFNMGCSQAMAEHNRSTKTTHSCEQLAWQKLSALQMKALIRNPSSYPISFPSISPILQSDVFPLPKFHPFLLPEIFPNKSLAYLILLKAGRIELKKRCPLKIIKNINSFLKIF